MTDEERTKEAKYLRDKRILEENPDVERWQAIAEIDDDKIDGYPFVRGLGVSPENYDELKNNIKPRDDAEAREKIGECYSLILETINYYMDIPLNSAKLISLWIVGTYFHEQFNTYPFLYINAMRGSGKTRLLKLISSLAKKGQGQVQTGITEAVLFRMPKGHTLCLDEAENIAGKDKAFLREYLNACYKKGGVVKRVKTVKQLGVEQRILDTFEPYKPIALANIWGMDEVLGDRCVTLILEKSSDISKTKKQENFDDNPKFDYIKRTLEVFSVVVSCRYVKKHTKDLWNDYVDLMYNDIYTYTTLTTLNSTNDTKQKKEEIERKLEEYQLEEFFEKIDKTNFNGRNLELFFPLLNLARELSEFLFEEILEVAKELVETKESDEFSDSRDISVYDFVFSMREQGLNYLPVKDLTQRFKIFAGEEDYINERWFGNALKRLNLVIDKKRVASGRLVILNYAKAQEKLKLFKKNDILSDTQQLKGGNLENDDL